MASTRITNIAATTLDKIKGTIADAVHDAVPFYAFLKKKGLIKKLDGGRKYYTPVLFGSAAGGWYAPGSAAPLAFTTSTGINHDAIQAAEYEWAYLYRTITITGDEEMCNQGTAQAADLVKGLVDGMIATMATDLNGVIYDNTDHTSFNSVDILAQASAAPAIYGGIAYNATGVTSGDWSNQYETGTNDYSDIISKMLALYLKIVAAKARPKLIAMHTDVYAAYEDLGVAGARFMDNDLVDLGFMNSTYKGIPIIIDELCLDTDNSTECLYMFDTNHMGLFVHKNRNVEVSKFKDSEALVDAKYCKVKWMGNLWCNKRNAQGVLTFSTGD